MRHHRADEAVPLDGLVPEAWRAVVIERDAKGRTRVNRTAYEICALQASRERLRREVWAEDAGRHCDPDPGSRRPTSTPAAASTAPPSAHRGTRGRSWNGCGRR